jgi:hypothetical protein
MTNNQSSRSYYTEENFIHESNTPTSLPGSWSVSAGVAVWTEFSESRDPMHRREPCLSDGQEVRSFMVKDVSQKFFFVLKRAGVEET